MAHTDVIVVGGGAVGAACAHALSHREVAVTVLEPGPSPGAATPAAAGMLAPFAESEPDDPMLRLAVRARDCYTELVPALEADTGLDIGLRTDGILQLAFTDEEMARQKATLTWQRQAGFPVDWLSVDEVRELVPGVGPEVLGATLAPEDGGLNPEALRKALLECAVTKQGTTILRESAEQLVFEGERVVGVRTAGGTLAADAVIVAAGCWSGKLRGLPRSLPVEPVRGQILSLPWPEQDPPAIAYCGTGYLMERSGRAVCGSTMERVGFDASTTEDGLRGIRQMVSRIYPALRDTPALDRWAGLRPVTPDRRPIVGPDPVVANLWYATGHGRNGILFAAMTGELIAGLYAGDELEFDITPIAPDRLWPA